MRRRVACILSLALAVCCAGVSRAQRTPPYKDKSLGVEQRVEDLLSRMTREEKIDMLGGFEAFYILPNARLGIPRIKMADGPLGVRNYGEATAFPAGISMAATWNRALMRAVGVAVGKEARSKGVHIMLSPGVNIYRAPMCGRNFEYFGEDPYLAGQMAAAYVKGVQSQDVVTTVKHYALNNQEWDRHNVSSDVDERTLQEIYLPAFKAAIVEGGAGAVMMSYNLVNGVRATENSHLIQEVLHSQWKFDGIVMSDWGATHDGIAAANAGLDLEMPSGRYMNRETLLPAITQGKVKEGVIDNKIRRILRVLFRFGFFDRDQEDASLPLYSPESRLIALEAAREGIVLLKNKDNVLPLERARTKSVLVVGPNAHPAVTGGGGSSRVTPFRAVSVLEGATQVAGNGVKVYYERGLRTDLSGLPAKSVFTSDGQSSLKGEYFPNPRLERAPSFTRMDQTIDFSWKDGPANDFPRAKYSIRWTGKIRAQKDDSYDFVIRADGAFRLFVNERLAINQWREGGVRTETVQMRLRANTDYSIRLEYAHNAGEAAISFGWGKPDRQVEKSAAEWAAKTDAAVVCVGFNAQTETEGADRSFALTAEEEQLINDVAKANPRTIVALMAGGNVSMTGWIENVAGLLHAWFPGQEGGTAIAEILFGDVNPSGKLPASFEKRWEDSASYASYYDPDGDKRVAYSEGIFMGYRHFDKTGIEPMFPFGFGLSYTSFDYNNLTLSAERIRKGQKLTVNFEITNTGKREGAEVAELYIRDLESSEPRPLKELKGFAKVRLKPGETKNVAIELDESALSFFSAKKNAWVAEPGKFEVLIGSSSKHIRLSKSFEIQE